MLAGASYDPFDGEEVSPEVQRLRDVVVAMTDRQKQVYQLVLLEERGYTEAAKIMDCSPANVKQMRHFPCYMILFQTYYQNCICGKERQ